MRLQPSAGGVAGSGAGSASVSPLGPGSSGAGPSGVTARAPPVISPARGARDPSARSPPPSRPPPRPPGGGPRPGARPPPPPPGGEGGGGGALLARSLPFLLLSALWARGRGGGLSGLARWRPLTRRALRRGRLPCTGVLGADNDGRGN